MKFDPTAIDTHVRPRELPNFLPPFQNWAWETTQLLESYIEMMVLLKHPSRNRRKKALIKFYGLDVTEFSLFSMPLPSHVFFLFVFLRHLKKKY